MILAYIMNLDYMLDFLLHIPYMNSSHYSILMPGQQSHWFYMLYMDKDSMDCYYAHPIPYPARCTSAHFPMQEPVIIQCGPRKNVGL